MDLVKHPSPAQPSSAVQGSDKVRQIQATFTREEHRDLIDMWWASYLYNLLPHEHLPRGNETQFTTGPCTQSPVPALLPGGPLSVEEMENSIYKATSQLTAQDLLLCRRLY